MKLKCQKCNSNGCVFYKDLEDSIEYCMCKDCGKVWREINDTIPHIDETADLADMIELLPLDPFEAYTEAAIRQKMRDYVFKCNVCGAFSFEVELGFYQCSNEECSFEWEEY